MERFTIQRILPQEGNFATLKVLNTLKMSLAPSEEEHKKYEIKTEEGLITWNQLGKEESEIEIGEKATDLIIESLKKLDESKKLTNEHFSIYEKFIK
jgi:hypothetical protein